MAKGNGRLDAIVLFAQRRGGPDVSTTSLWQDAAEIPGVRVAADPGGASARRFAGRSSGHVVLYAPDGHLMFAGGVTPSRGHDGDSVGLEALRDAAFGRPLDRVVTRVFGCSLPTGS
jgi:hypothetical protein